MRSKLYSIEEIASIMQASKTLIVRPDAVVGELLFDSRKITQVDHALFFALEGRVDGHAFVRDAYAAGVRNFVVLDHRIDYTDFPGGNFVVVGNTLAAMQDLAAYHRAQFKYPVIGITGSNGKTIVKEWLFQLLSPEYTILRSPKSYNSQLGVALSVWQMDDGHDLAIIEAGISTIGEMRALRKMIRPDIAVLTNVGPAHAEGFVSLRQKTEEKLFLFEGAGTVIYAPEYLDGVKLVPYDQVFTWSEHQADAKLKVSSRLVEGNSCRITALIEGNEESIIIPFVDAASIENALCCWSVMLAMGYSQAVISDRMATLQPMTMRLELKKGVNDCSLIDDSYSNDLASLAIALDFLKQQNQHPKRTVILSDIPEMGPDEDAVYNRIALLLREKTVDRFVAVGRQFMSHRAKFDFVEHHFFAETKDLIHALPTLGFRNETILIKGARKFSFEKISSMLVAKSHETVLEINLNALEHNLNVYRRLLPKGVGVMAMVKAFSYGSGSFEIANLLQFNKVDYLAVAYADEGVELRNAGIRLPIMVMSPDEATFEAIVSNTLEPEIYGFRTLEAFIDLLERQQVEGYPIHIKLDTGMHRLGFGPDEAQGLFERLSKTSAVKVKSVFSHLAAAGDGRHDDFTVGQLKAYVRFTEKLSKLLADPFVRHIANTDAIGRWPDAHMDMVRLGIGLYGIGGAGADLPLQQVGALRTTISQIRPVKAGETIGYGRRGRVTEDSMIATVKIGYADGYSRRFGNGAGYMSIAGQKVPTVGEICMDMCMLDITGVAASEGDEVLVFGDLVKAANSIGTIPYEILTGISQRVKRVYFYE